MAKTIESKVSNWIMENLKTNDIPELLRYDLHYVFVYGTLKYGGNRHIILQGRGAKFQGIATTVDSNYEMVNTQLGFPVVFTGSGNKGAYGKVKGELYAVTPETIMALDAAEANGHLFYRTESEVTVIRSNRIGRETLPCFMYLGTKSFWGQNAGYLVDMAIRNDTTVGPYYYYTREDSERYPGARKRA